MAKFLDQFSKPADSKTNIPMLLDLESIQESIRCLLKANESYSIAVEILRKRYANEQVLISSYMESFVKLLHITSIKSGLRAMYNLVEGNTRNL